MLCHLSREKEGTKANRMALVRFPNARPRRDSMRFHPFGFRNTCYQDVDASRVVARMATKRCCTARKRPAKSRLSGAFVRLRFCQPTSGMAER